MGMEASRYKPLPLHAETRVLEIQPGQGGEPIKCVVRNVDKILSASYEAIFYTWGSGQDLVDIECRYKSPAEDQPPMFSPLQVTRNCAAALRSYRLPDAVRVLWIDAVCIDQNDNADKAKQIQMMGKILKRAHRVLVYLSDFVSQRYSSRDQKPVEGPAELQTLSFRHPWFSRIWVIQEVFWARKLCVYAEGVGHLSWSTVCDLYRKSQHDDEFGPDEVNSPVDLIMAVQSMPWLPKRDKRFQMSLKLSRLAQRTKSFEATDPRDRLIALLPLADDVEQELRGILIDYSPNTNLDVLRRRYAVFRALHRLGLLDEVLEMLNPSDTMNIYDPQHQARQLSLLAAFIDSLELLRGTLAKVSFDTSVKSISTSPKSHGVVHMDASPGDALRVYWRDGSESHDVNDLRAADGRTKLATEQRRCTATVDLGYFNYLVDEFFSESNGSEVGILDREVFEHRRSQQAPHLEFKIARLPLHSKHGYVGFAICAVPAEMRFDDRLLWHHPKVNNGAFDNRSKTTELAINRPGILGGNGRTSKVVGRCHLLLYSTSSESVEMKLNCVLPPSQYPWQRSFEVPELMKVHQFGVVP